MDIEQLALDFLLAELHPAYAEQIRRGTRVVEESKVDGATVLRAIAAALKSAPAPEASEVTITLEWLVGCDNLVLLHSTPADAWQVRRASSGEVRGSGDTPFEAIRAAMLAARVAREGEEG